MIISNSMLNVAVRVFVLLLLDEVLPDERLVLDENDEPSEMNEFGRCIAALEPSAMVVENELRSFGAVLQMNKISIIFTRQKKISIQNLTFFQLSKTDRTIINLILAWAYVQTWFIANSHR